MSVRGIEKMEDNAYVLVTLTSSTRFSKSFPPGFLETLVVVEACIRSEQPFHCVVKDGGSGKSTNHDSVHPNDVWSKLTKAVYNQEILKE